MKRLIAIFITAGFMAATGIAQQAPAPQQQHVSHGDTTSVNSAAQSDSMATNKDTTSSNKKSKDKDKDSKKAKKNQKEPVKQTQPQ